MKKGKNKLEEKIIKFDQLKNEALQTLFYLTTRKEYNHNSVQECSATYNNYITICNNLAKLEVEPLKDFVFNDYNMVNSNIQTYRRNKLK